MTENEEDRLAASRRAMGLTRRPSRLAALAGLAVAAILAAGALTLVASRSSGPDLRSAGGTTWPAGGIDWHLAGHVPADFMFGPYLASLNGRVYIAGSGNSTGVWSSTDGATWQQTSGPGAIEKAAPGFVARALSDDGRGGLLLVGAIVTGETSVPVALQSTDGVAWTSAPMTSPSGELVGVATSSGEIVAFGDHVAASTDAAAGFTYGLDAWSSTDGVTWTHVPLPDSTGYQAIAVTSWKGGFAAIAQPIAGGWTASVWMSTDGIAWQKSPKDLSSLGPSTISAVGDRVVAMGSHLDSKLGMVPSAWWSTDGRTWVESTPPVRDPAVMFDAVATVGENLVAIGSSHMATTLELTVGASESTPWSQPPESVWVSGDGSEWRLLPANPIVTIGSILNTHLTSLGGRVVLATTAGQSVQVFLGDVIS
jgi:hypothetical protein